MDVGNRQTIQNRAHIVVTWRDSGFVSKALERQIRISNKMRIRVA